MLSVTGTTDAISFLIQGIRCYKVIWSAAVRYLTYFALPNKSDIGQAVDQTTVLLFPPRKCLNFSNLREIWMALIMSCDSWSPRTPYIKNYMAPVVPVKLNTTESRTDK